MGFWPDSEDMPSLSEQLIKREAELTQELRELVAKQQKYKDKEAMLREMRKQRLIASKQQQKENKERRKQEREEKARKWKETKEKQIVYLGEGVSGGLKDNKNDEAKLAKYSLPVFIHEGALAQGMQISVGKLRFLAFNRKVSKISHYRQFYMPKKTGGKRLISAPMPDLKAAQEWVLHNILYKVPVHDVVNGFYPKKSILTNASPHLGKDTVINIDLKDFFPTVTYRRVKGLFRSLGYSERISTILGLICTEANTQQVTLDDQNYYIAASERHLPQGAPSSPAITNLLCRKLDARLQGLAKKYQFTYTRYADDMTFSCDQEGQEGIKAFLANIRRVVKEEGFYIHPDKLRIMRKGARKEVTGIVVNEKPNITRKQLDRFRALIFQIEKDGPAGKTWNGSDNVLSAIRGYANFIKMVNPEKGGPLALRVDALLKKHNYKHVIRHYKKAEKTVASEGTSSKSEEKRPWWKFW